MTIEKKFLISFSIGGLIGIALGTILFVTINVIL